MNFGDENYYLQSISTWPKLGNLLAKFTFKKLYTQSGLIT